MAKGKFEITADLVKVESEPSQNSTIVVHQTNEKSLLNEPEDNTNKNAPLKENLSIKIDGIIKKDLQIYCVNNRKSMTEIIEKAVVAYIAQ